MKKFLNPLVYIVLLISIALNINLYTKYSNTYKRLELVSKTASNSYEYIFESIVHSDYYQTFDIGRVNLLQGKMNGASYCAEVPSKLFPSHVAYELGTQLSMLGQHYYNKGSFNDDDSIVYKEILQEISDVYDILTNPESSKDIFDIYLEIVSKSSSIRTKYYGEN